MLATSSLRRSMRSDFAEITIFGNNEISPLRAVRAVRSMR